LPGHGTDHRDELDEIAHGFDYTAYSGSISSRRHQAEQYDKSFPEQNCSLEYRRHLPNFPQGKSTRLNHHLAHAASAFYTSRMGRMPRRGDRWHGRSHSATAYHANDNQIDRLQENRRERPIAFVFRYHLALGFSISIPMNTRSWVWHPNGNPERYRHFFEQAIELLDNGTIRYRSCE